MEGKVVVLQKYKFQIGVAIWLALWLIVTPFQAAHAYLDAGTGSYAIQVVIGVIFGASFAIKSYWGRISTKVKHRFSRKND